MRRAKTQKMVIYEGGNEQGNSGSRKSKGSGGTIVIVDDATEDISAFYGSTGWSCLGNGGLLIDALMGTSSVVVIHELNQDAPQMSSIDDQDQIQTFLAGRANPSFCERVRVGGPERSGDHVEAFGLENRIKGWAERAIIVMDQEAQGLFSVG